MYTKKNRKRFKLKLHLQPILLLKSDIFLNETGYFFNVDFNHVEVINESVVIKLKQTIKKYFQIKLK